MVYGALEKVHSVQIFSKLFTDIFKPARLIAELLIEFLSAVADNLLLRVHGWIAEWAHHAQTKGPLYLQNGTQINTY